MFRIYTVFSLPNPRNDDFDKDGLYFVKQGNDGMSAHIWKEDGTGFVSLYGSKPMVISALVTATNSIIDNGLIGREVAVIFAENMVIQDDFFTKNINSNEIELTNGIILSENTKTTIFLI